MYRIRDISLAPQGEQKIEWVRRNMPILNGIRASFEKDLPFRGLKIALSIHLEAKTAYLCRVLAAGGAPPSYRVRWLDSEGDAREVSGVSTDIELELEAGTFTPIIVETESERAGIPQGFLPLAGAVYPIHARQAGDSAVVEADWMRGIDAACAELVCLKANGGYGCGHAIAAHFNWMRFDAELEKKANPFLVDARSAADAILSGKVSVYDIKERKLFVLSGVRATGGVPHGEAFIPAWPQAPGNPLEGDGAFAAAMNGAFATAADGSFAVSCPAGISRWFGKDGVLTVNAENGKLACAFFTRYGLRD